MNNHVLVKLEEYHQQFVCANEWMADVTRETDRRSRDMCNSISNQSSLTSNMISERWLKALLERSML